MNIRQMKDVDTKFVSTLMYNIGLRKLEVFCYTVIPFLVNNTNEYQLLVEDDNCHIIGLIAVHILPFLALRADFLYLGPFSIKDFAYGNSLSTTVLEDIELRAIVHGCPKMELYYRSRNGDFKIVKSCVELSESLGRDCQ
ncbi:hypothetical protein [Sphingobacterium sp. WOUb80]|uniref:hypothetical protein n=1 Tax=Sphingobacterium sp. WOUb80 TaxID=3234028 RepID=UPI003CE8DA28